jgi:hypothetical protein
MKSNLTSNSRTKVLGTILLSIVQRACSNPVEVDPIDGGG